jgi:methyl-accepting chemotaxis protein
LSRNLNDILSRVATTGTAFANMRQTLENLVKQSNHLTEAARGGELDKRGETAQFGGVYGELVEGINNTLDAMVAPIDETAEVLGQVAERDLTVRVQGEYHGDFARIKETLNLALENLEGALNRVTDTAEQVSSASTQISSGSQELAEGAAEQAGSLEDVTHRLQRITVMSKENTGKAAEARELAEKARTSVDKGVASMGRLSESIDRIKAQSQVTAKRRSHHWSRRRPRLRALGPF